MDASQPEVSMVNPTFAVLALFRLAKRHLGRKARQSCRGEAGRCLDWISVPGLWCHTLVRFHLRGGGMHVRSPAGGAHWEVRVRPDIVGRV